MKILVTYATRKGSTSGIASMLAHTLSHAPDVDADLSPVRDVATLDGYDAVVLGSAVRLGAWLPEAVSFVQKHQERLRQMPVAYFTVCMTVTQDTPEYLGYTAPARALVEPICEEFFAGAIDPDRFSWLMRMLIKAHKLPTGDHRDWKQVKRWAAELSAQLHAVDYQGKRVIR